jgi:hypothetical protein
MSNTNLAAGFDGFGSLLGVLTGQYLLETIVIVLVIALIIAKKG